MVWKGGLLSGNENWDWGLGSKATGNVEFSLELPWVLEIIKGY